MMAKIYFTAQKTMIPNQSSTSTLGPINIIGFGSSYDEIMADAKNDTLRKGCDPNTLTAMGWPETDPDDWRLFSGLELNTQR